MRSNAYGSELDMRQGGEAAALGRATALSRAAARVSLAAAITFLVLVASLHVVKPEFAPSWRFLSEYAIGRHGWIMVLAFQVWAVSCAAAVVAVRPCVRTIGGRIGLAALLAVAFALAAAGVFVMDPVTARQEDLTAHGNIHALASMVGIPGLPIAAVLISRSLARTRAWTAARRSLLGAAHATWISLAVMAAALPFLLSRNGGAFGPEVPAGWLNRLVVAAYCAWLITVSRQAERAAD